MREIGEKFRPSTGAAFAVEGFSNEPAAARTGRAPMELIINFRRATRRSRTRSNVS